MKKAVVLLSGGIDSATALAIAKSEEFQCYAISFDYKQRHIRELESAMKVAEAANVEEHLIVPFDLRAIGGSALTAGMPVPKGTPARSSDSIPVTYVPARNTIFLSFALSWAEVMEAGDIFIGANAVDYSGYPDCRPEYIEAFNEMANLATKASVEGKMRFRIRTPLISMKKSEIILTGYRLGVDYALTWSCYDPRYEAKGTARPCGGCESCIFRVKGFEEAGLEDPLAGEGDRERHG
jgi:7-cyano-7-deazaguanine synthase